MGRLRVLPALTRYTREMPLRQVATLDQLPPGSVVEVMVDSQPFALCRTHDAVYALDGVCPHRGGPLGHGQIHAGHLVCPFHLWEFDCHSGEYGADPTCRVPTYEVNVQDGNIFLEVP